MVFSNIKKKWIGLIITILCVSFFSVAISALCFNLNKKPSAELNASTTSNGIDNPWSFDNNGIIDYDNYSDYNNHTNFTINSVKGLKNFSTSVRRILRDNYGWKNLGYDGAFSGKTVYLLNDIDLIIDSTYVTFYGIGIDYGDEAGDGETIETWNAWGSCIMPNQFSFRGCFDGQGHTIKNWLMRIGYHIADSDEFNPTEQSYAGLFLSVGAETIIKNLKVDNFTYIDSKSNYIGQFNTTVAGIVAISKNQCLIQNCEVGKLKYINDMKDVTTKIGNACSMAGIFGFGCAKIENCYVKEIDAGGTEGYDYEKAKKVDACRVAGIGPIDQQKLYIGFNNKDIILEDVYFTTRSYGGGPTEYKDCFTISNSVHIEKCYVESIKNGTEYSKFKEIFFYTSSQNNNNVVNSCNPTSTDTDLLVLYEDINFAGIGGLDTNGEPISTWYYDGLYNNGKPCLTSFIQWVEYDLRIKFGEKESLGSFSVLKNGNKIFVKNYKLFLPIDQNSTADAAKSIYNEDISVCVKAVNKAIEAGSSIENTLEIKKNNQSSNSYYDNYSLTITVAIPSGYYKVNMWHFDPEKSSCITACFDADYTTHKLRLGNTFLVKGTNTYKFETDKEKYPLQLYYNDEWVNVNDNLSNVNNLLQYSYTKVVADYDSLGNLKYSEVKIKATLGEASIDDKDVNNLLLKVNSSFSSNGNKINITPFITYDYEVITKDNKTYKYLNVSYKLQFLDYSYNADTGEGKYEIHTPTLQFRYALSSDDILISVKRNNSHDELDINKLRSQIELSSKDSRLYERVSDAQYVYPIQVKEETYFKGSLTLEEYEELFVEHASGGISYDYEIQYTGHTGHEYRIKGEMTEDTENTLKKNIKFWPDLPELLSKKEVVYDEIEGKDTIKYSYKSIDCYSQQAQTFEISYILNPVLKGYYELNEYKIEINGTIPDLKLKELTFSERQTEHVSIKYFKRRTGTYITDITDISGIQPHFGSKVQVNMYGANWNHLDADTYKNLENYRCIRITIWDHNGDIYTIEITCDDGYYFPLKTYIEAENEISIHENGRLYFGSGNFSPYLYGELNLVQNYDEIYLMDIVAYKFYDYTIYPVCEETACNFLIKEIENATLQIISKEEGDVTQDCYNAETHCYYVKATSQWIATDNVPDFTYKDGKKRVTERTISIYDSDNNLKYTIIYSNTENSFFEYTNDTKTEWKFEIASVIANKLIDVEDFKFLTFTLNSPTHHNSLQYGNLDVDGVEITSCFLDSDNNVIIPTGEFSAWYAGNNTWNILPETEIESAISLDKKSIAYRLKKYGYYTTEITIKLTNSDYETSQVYEFTDADATNIGDGGYEEENIVFSTNVEITPKVEFLYRVKFMNNNSSIFNLSYNPYSSTTDFPIQEIKDASNNIIGYYIDGVKNSYSTIQAILTSNSDNVTAKFDMSSLGVNFSYYIDRSKNPDIVVRGFTQTTLNDKYVEESTHPKFNSTYYNISLQPGEIYGYLEISFSEFVDYGNFVYTLKFNEPSYPDSTKVEMSMSNNKISFEPTSTKYEKFQVTWEKDKTIQVGYGAYITTSVDYTNNTYTYEIYKSKTDLELLVEIKLAFKPEYKLDSCIDEAIFNSLKNEHDEIFYENDNTKARTQCFTLEITKTSVESSPEGLNFNAEEGKAAISITPIIALKEYDAEFIK